MQVGDNGAGKSTLLKILLGDLEPTKGFRTAHRHLKIGYFAQHHIDMLDMDCTAVQLMQKRYPGLAMEEYRRCLGRFEVGGDMAVAQSLQTFSGGQKCRVAFAVMAFNKPNFLILDEPVSLPWLKLAWVTVRRRLWTGITDGECLTFKKPVYDLAGFVR